MEKAKSHSLAEHPGVERDRLVWNAWSKSPNADGSHFERFAFTKSNHRFLCRSLLLRFRSIIAITDGMVRSAIPFCVSCVATSPYNTPSWHFYELHSQPFPQKKVNVRNTESSCPRFYVTGMHPASAHASMTLGREPRWRHFHLLWRPMENRIFNQIKKKLRQITPKSKLHHVSEKKMVWGAV